MLRLNQRLGLRQWLAPRRGGLSGRSSLRIVAVISVRWETPLQNALVVEGSFEAASSYSYVNGGVFCSDGAEPTGDDWETVLGDNCSLRCFAGCDGHGSHYEYMRNRFLSGGGAYADIDDRCKFAFLRGNAGSIAVVDFSGTSQG